MNPRDQCVDPEWWETLAANEQRNLAFCEKQVAEGVDGAEDLLWQERFHIWLRRYSAGETLDVLVPQIQEIVVGWAPCIADNTLVAYRKELGSLAHLVGRADSLVGLNPNGNSFPLRFPPWLFGDENALESNQYDDPPKRGGIIDKRVELVKTCRDNPDEASTALVKYVRQDWYRGSKGEGWWGTHNYRGGGPSGYCGYWCWEAAAIAKIFNVDDSDLEGHKYYPYDLAHVFDESSAFDSRQSRFERGTLRATR